MKKILQFIIFSFFLMPVVSWGQKATHIVIAEVYPGGGNTSATFTNDYIVLYNPTDSSINLSTWSVQYQTAGSTASPWVTYKTDLSGSISAGGYYMIQEYSPPSPVGLPLPVTPNVSGAINMNATGAKIALVNSQNFITGISDGSVIDFVGWGNANTYEGGSAAPALYNNSSSIRRMDNSGNPTYGNNGSGWDSDENSVDFYKETDLATNQPLPVQMISFSVSTNSKKVNLSWKTATEVNNYGFDVERSPAGKENDKRWEKIGFVQGSGNSNSPRSYSFSDEPLGGTEFNYRLKQIDLDGEFEYSDQISVTLEDVTEFELEQNYPNPFNPSTRISYTIPRRSDVKLRVYNMLAQLEAELVNESQEAGHYQVLFNGSNLPSGTYFYKLEAGKFIEVKKFLLVK